MSRAPTGFEAELNCVVLGLSQVTARWTELNDYLSTLIVQDFMEPKKYWRFLFDDENFTLSKRYFWAIGCLAEFIGYIKDNNQQWDWFYEARIEPLLREENLADRLDAATLDENDLPDLDDSTYTAAKIKEERLKKFQNLVNEGKKSRDALANLQTQFENKLDTFKTLRDGLFNASALIESRASTRLGQNVKLLTYVSIFYLPLAFCAALWAIPNIQDKATKIPFVITAILVGVVTYAIVFNMDFITNKAKSWYFPRRENVVAEMRKEEQSELWRGVGQKFEQLQPQSKSQVPTEWWIPTFVTLQVFKRGAWTWKQPSEKNQLVNQAKGETGKSSDASPERGSTSAAHNADGEKEVKSSRLMFWRGKKSHDPHV
ncbi:hypothetical protein NA56DRAFT_637974 [Hyaloscypha hepaticicola]|uniref:Uncharacterized protein n=1 Tax=Hyaloscypha hepaticicola TaxID=2082293 RepID=A0A2J6PGU6_9HELO|nr:hypothetical protein NA56DRAFT_637974 [Hyaloscypha hepaticicola]